MKRKFLNIFFVTMLIAALLLTASCSPRRDDTSSTQPSVSSSQPNIISSMEDMVSSKINEITSSDTASGEEPSSPTAAKLSEIECIDNTKVTWGPGVSYNSENRPTAPCELQEKYGEYSAYFIAENTANIYLTFDEGYENGYTAKILDVLKKKNVSAVFFVTMPYVKSNPDLIRRMIDEGHIVGNHSNKHLIQHTLSLEDAAEEYISLHDYVKENFNYTMTLFRPPQGEFSERSLALGQALGYKNVMWSFAYADYDINNQPDPEKAFQKIVSRAHNGEIMLLHAVSKTNAEILGRVIDELRCEGYTFCKFDL